MGLLYKDSKDVNTSVEITELKDGMISLLFTCDGGKFGTDEILDGFTLTPLQLLDAVRGLNLDE